MYIWPPGRIIYVFQGSQISKSVFLKGPDGRQNFYTVQYHYNDPIKGK